MTTYVNLISILFLTLVICTVTRADPCNTNFGGCDKRNGLCWGTGEDTHYCSCKAGFKKDPSSSGHVCVDINECEGNVCGDNAVCQNTYGSYRCLCNCGYVMDYTGTTCLDANKIADRCMLPRRCYKYGNPVQRVPFLPVYSKEYVTSNRGGMMYSRSFRGRRGRRRCKCEKGFRPNRCGFCVDYNECYRRPCSGPGSTCTNTEGAFYCGCRAPFVLGPCKERCYRSQDVPQLCRRPRLNVLFRSGFEFETYNQPIVLRNFRSCSANVSAHADTSENFDTDGDGKIDVRLRWHCVSKDDFGSVSVLKKYSMQAARWRPWSCWTACKATCWGGLQTRSRICAGGLPGQEGCKGDGSEKKSCYTGPKCPYKIRRDAEKLTDAELKDLVQAMKKYKEDMTATGFHNAASAHGWPFQCDRSSCCRHGAKVRFLAWHRSITLNFEQGLSRYLKDKTLGIPYWNWLREDQSPPKWVYDRQIFGAENPFANMTVLIDRSGPMRTIQRDDDIFTFALEFTKDTWLRVASQKKKAHIMHEFAESVESLHGGPHVSVCGNGFPSARCLVSLGVLNFAAFDPIFMLHHSQTDRLWAVAQLEMANAKSTTWTPQTALEALEEAGDFGRRFQPFNNRTLSPFPMVRATNTMRDSYYYEELTGIKYDYIGSNGLPSSASRRRLRPGGNERLFIGHYFKDVEVNVQVNYYYVEEGFELPCSELAEFDFMGSVFRMGTSNPYNLTVPELVPVTTLGINTPGLEADMVLKACYTYNTTCRARCPEATSPKITAQVDPMIVYYIRNQPVDIHKFVWAEGKTVPNWYINIHSGTHWIYFHGSRRNQIVQVRTSDEFSSCNASAGRPFRCGTDNGEACLLPSGVYYLIDIDKAHCEAGLQMLIISRK